MWLKKILKLTAKLKKAYFSGIAQIELAYIVSETVPHLFEVKDPYRPVFSAILCRFSDFCNTLQHITGVSILFQPQLHTETSHAYPQCMGCQVGKKRLLFTYMVIIFSLMDIIFYHLGTI